METSVETPYKWKTEPKDGSVSKSANLRARVWILMTTEQIQHDPALPVTPAMRGMGQDCRAHQPPANVALG